MIQLKLTTKEHAKNVDEFLGLISSITDVKLKAGLMKILETMGERLFEAPASNKLEYHNCFSGGLVDHSLRVYRNLRLLRDSFAPEISDDSIILVSLFHDLGKVGSVDEPYFIPQTSAWHKEKLGMYYEHNTKIGYLGTAQRSLRLFDQFNVPTTEDEYKAVLIHDGQYIPENKPYAHKEGMLGLLLHQADMLACKMEHDKWESAQ